MKIIKLLKFIVLLILIIYAICISIAASIRFDKDVCLDSSICKAGLEINNEYGLIKVNKENSLKYKWFWDDKKKSCNLNK